jgi:putative transposase
MKIYQREFPVEKMCGLLGVSSSAYFTWENGTSTKHIVREQLLKEKVEQIYNGSHYTYGSPRVFSVLKEANEKVSRSLVARVMKKVRFSFAPCEEVQGDKRFEAQSSSCR